MASKDEGELINSRDQIISTAAAMLKEGGRSRLSVRAVAARAGVSTGSLRHFFPTQRELLNAVLSAIYEEALPDGRIHDQTLPARERLLDCLRSMLAQAGTEDRAREIWNNIFLQFIASTATRESRDAYIVLSREAQRRIEYWLSVLASEGALSEGDNTQRAKFLLTVINGLSIERALPAEDSVLKTETDTLIGAVEFVLRR